jgi:spore coat polysaccharide biosynthesis protein SpsF (cytidylyltransferase family)
MKKLTTYISDHQKMPIITNVAIGIQARSTSHRFPRKIFADICGKPMLKWVIDAAHECRGYLGRPNLSRQTKVDIAILCPFGDELKDRFRNCAQIIEGPEDDVLSRYYALKEFYKPDYVVRITGDCPLIPAPVITKCINVAVLNRYDYVSNVDERLRLSVDGMDCEVISSRLLEFLQTRVSSPYDREHVTTFIRHNSLPSEFTTAHLVGYFDLSGLKLSVDTEEDLARVRAQKELVIKAMETAEGLSGKRSIHRF